MKRKKDNVVHIRAVVPLEEGQKVTKLSKIDKHKKVWILGVCFVVLLVAIWGISTQFMTYTSMKVLRMYDEVNMENNSSVVFQDGVLRYGKDGIAYMNNEGKEVWNHPYQVSNPIVEITDQTAVVADLGGNDIIVVNQQGVKGEIETFLPIEKVSVSGQGIVAVLVKDSYTPQIICYDAVGNVLVEHKTSLQGTGYPIDLSLSYDGMLLLVSYLQVSVESIATHYVYYNFSGNNFVTENVVGSGTRSDEVVPEVKFIDEDTSVLIGENSMEIFTGSTTPVLTNTITINKEIKNVFYGENKVGVLLKESNKGECELRIYNDRGELLFNRVVVGEYKNIEIVGNQIMLYDGEKCLIYSMRGTEKFNGKMDMEISSIFPVFGVNKYVIIGDEGMKKVQLAR